MHFSWKKFKMKIQTFFEFLLSSIFYIKVSKNCYKFYLHKIFSKNSTNLLILAGNNHFTNFHHNENLQLL